MMQIYIKKIEPYLPTLFKYLNHCMVLLWKLGLGKLINIWPSVFGRILVIRHQGRTSGSAHLAPLNFIERDDGIYVVSGFGAQSDWYRNIMANPQVEVWLPDGWYAGQAESMDAHADRLPIIREVLIASGFVAPLLGIYPRTISDVELKTITNTYKLVKMDRQSARTGADGPGSLAWMWPLILMYFWLRKKKR